jgi:hypothetical protein
MSEQELQPSEDEVVASEVVTVEPVEEEAAQEEIVDVPAFPARPLSYATCVALSQAVFHFCRNELGMQHPEAERASGAAFFSRDDGLEVVLDCVRKSVAEVVAEGDED